MQNTMNANDAASATYVAPLEQPLTASATHLELDGITVFRQWLSQGNRIPLQEAIVRSAGKLETVTVVEQYAVDEPVVETQRR